jgi:hypothetical protein
VKVLELELFCVGFQGMEACKYIELLLLGR